MFRIKISLIVIFFILISASSCTSNNSAGSTDAGSGSSTCSVYKTQYYVDPAGNDANDGLSAATAWKNLSKVNNASYSNCSKVNFLRGGTWRGQLYPQSYMAYGAYGVSVNKPIILGSLSGSGAAVWNNVAGYSSNLWRSTFAVLDSSAVPLDVGNLIFLDNSNNLTAGFKKFSADSTNASILSTLINQGDFWSDPTTGYVWMKSSSNPGGYYSGGIEAATSKDIIRMNSVHDILIENLALKYGGGHGINAIDVYNLTLQDLDISWIGGATWVGHENQRFGNGIQLWKNAHDILVQRNKVWNIYDTGVTNQADGTALAQVYNVTYQNNVIWNVGYAAAEIWNYGLGASSISNLQYIQNTSVNPGQSWSSEQRPDCKGEHVLLDTVTNPPSGVVIKNNIFYGGFVGLWVKYTSASQWNSNTVNMDFNDYYQTGTSTQSFSDPAQWRNSSGPIWYVVMTAGYTGLLINGSYCQTKGSLAALALAGDCWFESSTGKLYLYSATNPGLAYSSVIANLENKIAILYDVRASFSAAQLADFQNISNLDNHSLTVDPLFSSLVSLDFHLTSASPVRAVGAFLSVETDYDLLARPSSGAQDLGAFKF